MRFEEYDYISGNVIGPLETIDFGDVVQGQHCVRPTVIRAFAEADDIDATNLDIYLSGKGSWAGASFGYRVDATFTPMVEAGGPLMTGHFETVPDATSGTPGGALVPFDGTSSAWIWLDVYAPTDQTGTGEPLFRVTYEHS